MTSGSQPRGNAGAVGAPRRRLPGPERRALILDAALATFAAHGYDAASMDQIAAAAGVSKAVVYDHVASKRELYTLLVDTIWRRLEAGVEGALAPVDGGGDGEVRVRAATTAFFRFVGEQPEACRLLLLEVHGANVSAFGRTLDERITAGVAGAIGGDPRVFDGHPERERQLAILAELIKSAAHGLASWWYRHPDVPCEDLVDRTVALIWPALQRAGNRS